MSVRRSRHYATPLAILAGVGSLTLLAACEGIGGNVSSSVAGSPTVVLTSPSAGVVRGTVTASATVTAGSGVRSVEFFVDGSSIGVDTTSPYSISQDSHQLPDGTKTVTATVVDSAGTKATSDGRQIEIDNVAPYVSSTPTPTATPTGTAAPTAPATPTPTATPIPTATPTRPSQADLERRYTAPASGLFGVNSTWRTGIAAAPVAAGSPTLVANLAKQVADHYSGVAAFNVWDYSTTVAVAAADEPKADVVFDDCQHKGYTPAGLYGAGGQFVGVPIPPGAVVSSGTDKELTVYSPSSDQLWEFWVASKTNGVWKACWGGRIDHVSTSPGYFAGYFGATATGLPNAGGMVSIADVRRGRIDHALSLQVIDAAQANLVSYPAQRSDGQGSGPIREGQRFRLDPAFDVAGSSMNAVEKLVARAAQEYGFVVTDKGGAVAVLGESGNNLTANGATNPWGSMLGSTPSYSMLKGFPWNRLQALPIDWAKPAPAAAR